MAAVLQTAFLLYFSDSEEVCNSCRPPWLFKNDINKQNSCRDDPSNVVDTFWNNLKERIFSLKSHVVMKKTWVKNGNLTTALCLTAGVILRSSPVRFLSKDLA